MSDLASEYLYCHALNRAWRGQIWAALTGRSRQLLALAEIDATCVVHARRYAGLRTVPINLIRGSQGRSHDFDRDFNPLQAHTKGRWLSVAAAWQRGKQLPPVDLIQVGDFYFVQDGHHRISVAQALGQWVIEAEVTIWKVTGLLPWETSTPESNHAALSRPTGDECILGRLLCEVARLQAKTLRSVGDLLGAIKMTLRSPVAPRPGVDGL
jgi:hypothetical protein